MLNPARVLAKLTPAKALAKLNPARALANQFLRRSPAMLLAFGVAVSLVDFAALYFAAAREGVLHINQGIGLFSNYGIFSTLLGNAISFYATKKYYDAVCSMKSSGAVINTAPIRSSLAKLELRVKMHRRYPPLIHSLIIVGALAWVANTSIHLFGTPEGWWGHKVFDSKDHLLSFLASRIHNLYTWLIIMPFVGHVMACATFQLNRAMERAYRKGVLKYDLLNPDQRGGFGFVDRAHIAFNIVAAFVYIQITTHILTFGRLNAEHIIAYASVTVLLFGINRIFLGKIYATIRTLRLKSLNQMKDKVFMDDKLSFEVLKYCYERRISTSTLINFIIKAGAILVPGVIKLWPFIRRGL